MWPSGKKKNYENCYQELALFLMKSREKQSLGPIKRSHLEKARLKKVYSSQRI